MQKEKISLRRLFKKVFSGKASAFEEMLADDWFRQLDLTEQAEARGRSNQQIEKQMLSAILKKIQPQPTKVYRWSWLRMAGIFLLLGLGVWLLYRPSEGKVFRASAKDTARQVTLPDGSSVWLNAHSSLSWNDVYGRKERRVQLVGEAFFDVKKSADAPFFVEMGALQTTVLGTTFNAEHLTDEAVTRISLISGAVQLHSKDAPAERHLLKPGETMRYHRLQKRFKRKRSAVTDPAAWIDGNLVFNEIPLKDALDRLAKQYRLNIQYDPAKLHGKTVTATLPKLEASEALRAVLFAHEMQFTKLKDGGIMVN